MRFAYSCPICGSQVCCSCTAKLTQYFAILQASISKKVSTVSTVEDGSGSGEFLPCGAHLDKLILELAVPLARAELGHRLKQIDLEPRVRKLRDGRWYLQIGAIDDGIFCSLNGMNGSFVYRLITRPSAFSKYNVYIDRLKQILTDDEIKSIKVARLDLALDYKVEIQKILQGFDYINKQSVTTFQDQSGRRTGMTIGRGTEKIVIYDKALERRQPGPLTRIEFQLSGRKLPSRTLKGVEIAILKDSWNPFQSISLNSVSFTSIAALPLPQQDKVRRLKGIVEREGLFSARRTLNGQGNFNRDYGDLCSIQPWLEQPECSFKKEITDFFDLESKEVKSGVI